MPSSRAAASSAATSGAVKAPKRRRAEDVTGAVPGGAPLPSAAMTLTPAPPPRTARRLSRRGAAVFVVAALAIVIATVIGVQGLLRSPVASVAADGTAVLRGTWEPYACTARVCDGYVQAGARSVFVVLHPGCPRPRRAAEVTVTGKRDGSLGSGAYRATGCTG